NAGTSLEVTTTLSAGDFTEAAGFLKANYSLPASASYNSGAITQKTLTVTGVTAENKTYDGNNTATLDTTAAALAGKIMGDDTDLNTAGSIGTFTSVHVGKDIPIVVSGMTINGTDQGNYSLTQPTGITANITGSEPSPIPEPERQSVPIQQAEQLYINPFLSIGKMGGIMMMTPEGGIITVGAPITAVPVTASAAVMPVSAGHAHTSAPASIAVKAPAPVTGPLPTTAITPAQAMVKEAISSAVTARMAPPGIFSEVVASAASPAPAEFKGIGVAASAGGIITPAGFEGISSKVVFTPKPSFNEMTVKAQCEPIVNPCIFNLAEPVIQMPQRATFAGVKVQTTGLQLTGSDTFKDARCVIRM
ncbi:MAG: YDG domain-containing protein, partial [Candidatus Omnitrophota bacterium]